MKPRVVVLSLLLLMSGLSTTSADAQRVVRADLAVSPDGAMVATSTGAGTLLPRDAAQASRRTHR